MRSYKALNKQVFSSDIYSIVPLRSEDRFDIMEWRNEQMYHLRQSNKLTIEDQNSYFNNVIDNLFKQKKPKQILFSFLKNDKCIGYGGLVHINWINSKAEVSFIMKTSLENLEFEKNWTIFLSLLKKVAFHELNLKSIYTYAYDLRPLLYPTLKKNGFKLKSHLKDEIEIEGKKTDVFIHEAINPISLFKIREAREFDSKLIFNWSNDTLARTQSYNSKVIDFKDHEKWFKNKLMNKNSLLLINEYKNKNIGLVKFEVEKNSTVVGILTCKKFRGKGLSALMLINSTRHYFTRFNLPILAYIKESNIPSIKTFKKAGYKFLENKIVSGIKSTVYKFERI